MYDVAIVGGGIAGLSAAWYLQQGAPHLEYILLEGSDRWGGHILTERVSANGSGKFVVEAGPDSFITQKPHGLQLARELGLENRLLGTNDKMRQVYVLQHGRPTPLPDGVLLIVPTKFMPFVFSPLISPLGKLRMGMDLFIRAKRDGADETLADFVCRRLGSEALDKIAEPLLSGIYNSEAEKQSLLATFPRFRALEGQYGSLTRGMWASRQSNSKPKPSGAGNGKPITAFASFRSGMDELVNALVARQQGEMQLKTLVRDISREPGAYILTADNGRTIRTRSIVLATPAFVTADLMGRVAPNVARELQAIRYVSTGTISLAYRAQDIRQPLRGFGLVVPRSECRPINAVTISSSKFEQRAPEGFALFRVFFGGSRSPQSMGLDDVALGTVVRGQLRKLFGIDAAPLFHRIYRWHRSNAQYDVGHLDRVANLEKALPPRLYLVGSAYRGVGIPDCIKQSQDVVKQIIASTNKG